MSLKAMKIAFGLIGSSALSIGPAFAAGGGGGLPWEAPLQQIQQSINGERTPKGRRVRDLLVVEGYRNGQYRIESCSSEEDHRDVA